jgi:hypothetical protein
MFIQTGKIHNRAIADMDTHTAAIATLAAQRLDGTVFYDCVDLHGRRSHAPLSSNSFSLGVTRLNIQLSKASLIVNGDCSAESSA